MGEQDDDEKAEEFSERKRFQLLVIQQYLLENELLESLAAVQRETGLEYEEGMLPTRAVCEEALDMFKSYNSGSGGTEEESMHDVVNEQLLALVPGVCVTSITLEEPKDSISKNITAVTWASVNFEDFVALVATADRTLRLLGEEGQTLTVLEGLASPPIMLDTAPVPPGSQNITAQEALVTCMGGEAQLLHINRPGSDPGGTWSIGFGQKFKDHQKHATQGRFAPLPCTDAEDSSTQSRTGHFVTVGRDHRFCLYGRQENSDSFSLLKKAELGGEVTCCCWLGSVDFVMAARDDHRLHYWRVPADGQPVERMKSNMNASKDSVVSFTVLALAASRDGNMVAACTDKSRVIVFQAFADRQLRNLYGAIVDEYDMPSVHFSLDSTFLYTTSTLPMPSVLKESEDPRVGMVGQVVVFEVGTGNLALTHPCHMKPVRSMDRHPWTEALVTGSFDRTVKYLQ